MATQPGVLNLVFAHKCRVGKLVVGDLRLLAEPGVASISVTAEQWVRSCQGSCAGHGSRISRTHYTICGFIACVTVLSTLSLPQVTASSAPVLPHRLLGSLRCQSFKGCMFDDTWQQNAQ